MSTAAYEGEPGDGKKGVGNLAYIPYRAKLPDGTAVEVDTFKSKEEWQVGMDLMNLIIREVIIMFSWTTLHLNGLAMCRIRMPFVSESNSCPLNSSSSTILGENMAV
jgi:hypothetical protein